MLGTSLITRPLRIATRSAEITLHSAHSAIELAEGLVGLVAGRLIGHGHEHQHDDRPDHGREADRGPGPGRADHNGDGDGDGSHERAPWRARAAAVPVDPRIEQPQAAGASAPAAPPIPEPEVQTPPPDAEVIQEREATDIDYDATPPEPLQPETEHVSEEVELVEEVSEPGAEDGAGAQLRIAAPWDGYEQMKAADIIGRLASSSTAELAQVELYELSRRNRKSVVAAARRALKQASPPR